MASRTSQDQLSAGDLIGNMEIVEVFDDPHVPGQVIVVLYPAGRKDERRWVLK